MKRIVLFSGGCASAMAAKIVVDTYGKEDTILLHTPTYSEHPDNDRFRKEVSDFLGVPISDKADGRDVWQLMDDYELIPGMFMPFCTTDLKIKQTQKFIKTITEDFIIYYGFGMHEWRRRQKVVARNEAAGIKSGFPIMDARLNSNEIKRIIVLEWGIKLPEVYKHLTRANCVPCWKGSKQHFRKVWKYYPEKFWKAVEYTEKYGYSPFKDATLRQLSEKWETEEELLVALPGMEDYVDELFEDDEEGIPCICAS